MIAEINITAVTQKTATVCLEVVNLLIFDSISVLFALDAGCYIMRLPCLEIQHALHATDGFLSEVTNYSLEVLSVFRKSSDFSCEFIPG